MDRFGFVVGRGSFWVRCGSFWVVVDGSANVIGSTDMSHTKPKPNTVRPLLSGHPRDFQSGQAAYPWDRFNPDWVPSLHLGHDKLKESDEKKEKQQERSQRITERRKREREREEQEAMNRKAVKLDEPGERIKDIFMVNEGETSGETGEEEKEEEPNVENIASSQTDPEGYSRSCSTQTEECDYMFRTQKPWLPEKSTVFL